MIKLSLFTDNSSKKFVNWPKGEKGVCVLAERDGYVDTFYIEEADLKQLGISYKAFETIFALFQRQIKLIQE